MTAWGVLCVMRSWFTRCTDTLLACLRAFGIFFRSKLVSRDDRYSFGSKSILVFMCSFGLLRCANRYGKLMKAHFAWLLVTIRPSKLINSVASIQLASVASKLLVMMIAYCLIVRDLGLTPHGLLTTLPCLVRTRNFLGLLEIQIWTISHIQGSSQCALLRPRTTSRPQVRASSTLLHNRSQTGIQSHF